jgi:hypothetical protein
LILLIRYFNPLKIELQFDEVVDFRLYAKKKQKNSFSEHFPAIPNFKGKEFDLRLEQTFAFSSLPLSPFSFFFPFFYSQSRYFGHHQTFPSTKGEKRKEGR